MDGVPREKFDFIDQFIADYVIRPDRAEKSMAMDSLEIARKIVDINVPRKEILKICSGITPAKLAEIICHMNVVRALQEVAENGDLKRIPNVVLVGGSAEDFEVPEMLTESLSQYRIVCGRGNIRATEGPRNAVATGLVMSGTSAKR